MEKRRERGGNRAGKRNGVFKPGMFYPHLYDVVLLFVFLGGVIPTLEKGGNVRMAAGRTATSSLSRETLASFVPGGSDSTKARPPCAAVKGGTPGCLAPAPRGALTRSSPARPGPRQPMGARTQPGEHPYLWGGHPPGGGPVAMVLPGGC